MEDNDSIREAVAGYLRLDEHEVLEFGGVAGVIDAVRHTPPDLAVLDVMLPDGNGFQLAKLIRSESRAALLFLTARESESDRITGFELGADDYVVKPFSPKELVLRVHALLRRIGSAEKNATKRWSRAGHALVIDEEGHRVLLDSQEIALTAAEWRLLSALATQAGVVVSRDHLLGEALGYTADGSERTVDTHMKNLRAKLGGVEWIETVRGFGYRFAGSSETRRG